jgi:hypothetical protein
MEGVPMTHDGETGPTGGRRQAGRLVPSVGVGIAVAVLVAAVLGGSLLVLRHAGQTPAPSSAATHATTTSSVPTVTPKVVYALPGNSQPPEFFGADPKRRGVWFVTGTITTESIVFVSVDPNQDRAFPLHAHYSYGIAGGIAVAGDGTVWVGIRMALIHLDPTTGAMTTYPVPTPGDSAAAEAYNPSWIKGTHFINAVAVTGTDTVALAIQDADQVVLFRGGRFVDWSLPVTTVPKDVAYLNDGTLGVSLSDFKTHQFDRLVTYTPSGARSESQLVDVGNLISTGTQFVSSEPLADQVTVFNAHAQLTATVRFVPAITPNSSGLGILPDGELVAGGGDGVLIANLPSGATVDLRFPGVACPNPISFSVPPSYPPGHLCEQTPLVVATDGAGDVWMVLSNHPQKVDVLEGVGG